MDSNLTVEEAFALLELPYPPTPTLDDAHQSYKRLVLKYNPYPHANEPSEVRKEFEDKLKELNIAYELAVKHINGKLVPLETALKIVNDLELRLAKNQSIVAERVAAGREADRLAQLVVRRNTSKLLKERQRVVRMGATLTGAVTAAAVVVPIAYSSFTSGHAGISNVVILAIAGYAMMGAIFTLWRFFSLSDRVARIEEAVSDLESNLMDKSFAIQLLRAILRISDSEGGWTATQLEESCKDFFGTPLDHLHAPRSSNPSLTEDGLRNLRERYLRYQMSHDPTWDIDYYVKLQHDLSEIHQLTGNNDFVRILLAKCKEHGFLRETTEDRGKNVVVLFHIQLEPRN